MRSVGLAAYLKSFARPTILMLPLNMLGQITRTFSLMIRLFGNIMSGEFVIGIILAFAGLFVPIPLLALEIVVGIIQAYIFTVLAAVFIAAGVGAVETDEEELDDDCGNQHYRRGLRGVRSVR